MKKPIALLLVLTFAAVVLPADAQTDGFTKANARVNVRKNTGADVGKRRRLNLIEGANITLTVTDDSGNEEIDVTIAAAGGGGGDNVTVNGAAAADADLDDADPAAPANAINAKWQINTATTPDSVSAYIPYASGVLDVSAGNLTIAAGGVANSALANMAANTVKANATAGAVAPADLAVGTNTVVGRVAGNIVAAQLATGQIGANVVTHAKYQQITGPSVVGRAAGTLGDVDVIGAGSDGQVLQRVGGNLAFTTIDASASVDDGTVTYAKIQSVTDARLLGRSAGSAGAPMEITIGSGLSLVAGELAATGGGGGLSHAQVMARASYGF